MYLVTYGFGSGEHNCVTFVEALAVYKQHVSYRGGARVYNLARYDYCSETGEDDGLTEQEAAAIEAVNEATRWELAV